MNGFKQVMLVILVGLLSGCVAYSPSGVMAEKQPSVARAGKLVDDVNSLNLRKYGEQCWIDQHEVRADMINNDVTVAASARNVCGGSQY